MHLGLEIAVAGLVLVPLVAVALAYRRTRTPRLGFALLAFIALEARVLALLVIHSYIPLEHFWEEMISFGGDLAVITCFTAAFLHGTRWFGVRRADTA